MKRSFIVSVLLICIGFSAMAADIVIPLGGNAWVHGGKAKITDEGLVNWTSTSTITTIYFRSKKATSLNLLLELSVPNGNSEISLTVNKHKITRKIQSATLHAVDMGQFTVDSSGYTKTEIRGINKTGSVFANIKSLIIKGIALSDVNYVVNNEGNFFHWGRRGPSVHLNYSLPDEMKTGASWFYNEVSSPIGMDKIGSYFMANGFSVGYFGMQVNSATERRILFSVWSPEETDDPASIPEEKRIKLIKKGTGVHTGEFGNEGSGGQSYLVYPWKAGATYCFLLHAEPDSSSNSTIFTAWFKAKTDKLWHLIAGFKRPQTNTLLKSLHSFAENFEPDHGDETRKAEYGNQWIADINGRWTEITQASFSADNTARKAYRVDYSGGVGNNKFYLRNCGFFSDVTPIGQLFKRTATKAAPDIGLKKLP
ncbi:DUF3472 domain-containing protein [Mucilaginibacter sp. JRF]|uniref:DUF3472 domain-containing protein n=1 Tax=Mucilaginibacter sp. JRF TaxID=2780088 RepID=UPI001881D1E6|nr:DUF3472 domain-containing protein [Mucilaginibacter sp. JRF]MBE9586394.1 DUF3472 domain-containing protein [Mucilaginibacter sp. JRF]